MRADVVVLTAEVIEPSLVVFGGYAAERECPFQAAVKALYLPLGLRMPWRMSHRLNCVEPANDCQFHHGMP